MSFSRQELVAKVQKLRPPGPNDDEPVSAGTRTEIQMDQIELTHVIPRLQRTKYANLVYI